MSLKTQLTLFINGLLLTLLASAFYINLDTTRQFLQEQLASHAQDTATSLGLTLSHVADPNDLATMETLINAVFDRGYYLEIRLDDMNGKTLYRRTNPLTIEGIPDWFIRAVDLHAEQASAKVVNGWIPIGEVYVRSHPGYAYAQLWTTFINLLQLFVLLAVLATLLIWFYLNRLLAPLQRLVEQARALVRKKYVYQDDIPATTEFREVVLAINTMVRQLKKIFEHEAQVNAQLQKMAYQDETTGLGNRRYFDMVLNSMLADESTPHKGAVALVHLDNLTELNHHYGYLKVNALLKTLADSLHQTILAHIPQATLARINGSEVVVIAPETNPASLQQAMKAFLDKLPQQIRSAGLEAEAAPLHVAIIAIHPDEDRARLLKRLNETLHDALKSGRTLMTDECSSTKAEPEEEAVRSAIEQQRLNLLSQPACSADRSKALNRELYAQLTDENGDPMPARTFLPVLQKHADLAEAFDRAVIERCIEKLKHHPHSTPVAINLTPTILHSPSFVAWLFESVPEHLAARIAFEIPEHFLHAWPQACRDFIARAHTHGCQVGCDHFGRQMGDKRFLQRLQLNYVKLAQGFGAPLCANDEKTRIYLASLLEMAENLGIEVVATGIETADELAAYQALGIRWFQGYHLEAPKPLD